MMISKFKILWRISIETRSEQGHSDPKIECKTRPSQDASTHQIWYYFLKE